MNMKQPLGWQNITALLGAGIIGFFLFMLALIFLWPLLLISAIYGAIFQWKLRKAMKQAAGGMTQYGQSPSAQHGETYRKKVTVTVIDENGKEL